MALQFSEELPDDPAEATEAQLQAMLAFKLILTSFEEGEGPIFNDGESEEASLEV
jgi:hypothetical protein